MQKRKARGKAPASPEQLAEAYRIANRRGAAAANEYLRSLRPAGRVSRMRVVLDLIDEGLKHTKE